MYDVTCWARHEKTCLGCQFQARFQTPDAPSTPVGRAHIEALGKLSERLFEPELRTHKLRGELEGLWACWVEYDCRIVFAFETDPENVEDAIVLVDIGTHNEVY